MRALRRSSPVLARDISALDRRAAAPPRPPGWIAHAMPRPRVRAVGSGVTAATSGALALLSLTVQDAGRMDAHGFRHEVARGYDSIGRALRSLRRQPIRWWNYLPDPAAVMGPGLDRYMVFNAGRHEGYRRLTGEHGFERSLATASAVGVAGDSLVIHCLASRDGGRGMENPRQTPAWQYSRRYGPVPPSFARATIVTAGARRLLLIGGTASVVGEDSMHAGDVREQLEETLRNLAVLVSAARGEAEEPARSLGRLRDVRAYVTREDDVPGILATLRSRLPNAAEAELVPAVLCRSELLVEIEGVADL